MVEHDLQVLGMVLTVVHVRVHVVVIPKPTSTREAGAGSCHSPILERLHQPATGYFFTAIALLHCCVVRCEACACFLCNGTVEDAADL